MKYTVLIEETVTDTVTIDAASAKEAEHVVEQGYKEGKYILAPGELTGVTLERCLPDALASGNFPEVIVFRPSLSFLLFVYCLTPRTQPAPME